MTEENAKKTKNTDNFSKAPKEFNGPKGVEPTRYGDWERNGICKDF